MNKKYGPKTIDITVTEFDGIDRHQRIEPYEENVIAYRSGGKEGTLPYTDDIAGMRIAYTALDSLRDDQEMSLKLAGYAAACAWATGWEHMQRRRNIARSPRYLPQLGHMGPEVRPSTTRMIELGSQALKKATGPFVTLMTAAEDGTLTTRALLSAEADAPREVSILSGAAALLLACAEVADELKKQPEATPQEVQESLKATAIELTPYTRDLAKKAGTLPEFRALAETDSDISRFLRINPEVPILIRRAVASSREAMRDQFPGVT